MESVAKKVRTFDAFPKVDAQHTVRSSRGGFSTVLTALCALWIFWVEVGGFVGGHIDRQFSVDKEIKKEMSINVDILVAMPCKYLHTNVMDISRDKYLAAEQLNFEGYEFYVPSVCQLNEKNNRYNTPDLDSVMRDSIRGEFRGKGHRLDEEAPGCHVYGSIPVNQVIGEFVITGKGYGFMDRQVAPYEALNFSHVILEYSYGELFPFIDNPLDFTAKTTEEHFQAYKYYTKVVSTEYEKLGLVVDTNQFSVMEHHHKVDQKPSGRSSSVPGIYFMYEFEPIKLLIRERRMPFFQFIGKLATIIGFLLVVAGYIYRMYEKVVAMLFGQRHNRKLQEKKPGGLLDSETKKEAY